MLDEILHLPLGEQIPHIENLLSADLIPLLRGSPGIGKSAAILAVAAKKKLFPIDLRMAGCDPTDVNGFPMIDDVDKVARYYPLETFPIEGHEPPPGYEGWLLFLDELPSAPDAVQAASYKLLLDRAVGLRKLDSRVRIAAAGNLDTDGAIVFQLSSALATRVVQLECTHDFKFWLKWAQLGGKVNSTITSFLEFRPDLFFTFDGSKPDVPAACARTWDFAHRYMEVVPNIGGSLVPLGGMLNVGPANELIAFAAIRQHLPSKQEVMSSPSTCRQPGMDEPGALYALTGALGDWIDETTLKGLLPYIFRMPADFQVVTLRNACRRYRAVRNLPEMMDWINENADALV